MLYGECKKTAFSSGNISDVSHPYLSWFCWWRRIEEKLRRCSPTMGTICCFRNKPAFADRLQPVLLHQSSNPAPPATVSQITKIAPQPDSAVRIAALLESLADFPRQNGILNTTRTKMLCFVGVKAAAAHLHRQTKLFHCSQFGFCRSNSGDHSMTFGNSCPKIAKAFF